MKFYVYILQSKKDFGFYIGYTDEIDLRYEEHKNGKVTSTCHRRPLDLVYYEAYNQKETAQERERKLKQFGSAYVALLKRLGYKEK